MQIDLLSVNNLDRLGIFALMAKAFTQPESASRERRDTRADELPAKTSVRRRGLLEHLDHWFWTRQQRDVEAYLAQATDLYDLEARMRALERKVPHPYY